MNIILVLSLASAFALCSGRVHNIEKRGATGVRDAVKRVTAELALEASGTPAAGITALLDGVMDAFIGIDETLEYSLFGQIASVLDTLFPGLGLGDFVMQFWENFDDFMRAFGASIGKELALALRQALSPLIPLIQPLLEPLKNVGIGLTLPLIKNGLPQGVLHGHVGDGVVDTVAGNGNPLDDVSGGTVNVDGITGFLNGRF